MFLVAANPSSYPNLTAIHQRTTPSPVQHQDRAPSEHRQSLLLPLCHHELMLSKCSTNITRVTTLVKANTRCTTTSLNHRIHCNPQHTLRHSRNPSIHSNTPHTRIYTRPTQPLQAKSLYHLEYIKTTHYPPQRRAIQRLPILCIRLISRLPVCTAQGMEALCRMEREQVTCGIHSHMPRRRRVTINLSHRTMETAMQRLWDILTYHQTNNINSMSTWSEWRCHRTIYGAISHRISVHDLSGLHIHSWFTGIFVAFLQGYTSRIACIVLLFIFESISPWALGQNNFVVCRSNS